MEHKIKRKSKEEKGDNRKSKEWKGMAMGAMKSKGGKGRAR